MFLFIQELWERDYPELGLEFDIPFRELGFNGTPHRCAACASSVSMRLEPHHAL